MPRPPVNSTPMSEARRHALEELAERIRYRFEDITNLDRALIHSSLGNDGKASYERLEFLGDAILGFVVADHLFRTTSANEGGLTDQRSRVVRRATLALVASNLELPNYLEVGRGLQNTDITSRIHADLVEAVLGAIYLDGGIRAARQFVRRHVLTVDLDGDAKPEKSPRDPKSRLLHMAQAHELGQPRYRLVDKTGPDHAQEFTAAVLLEEREVAQGTATTKQKAEMAAAERALEILRDELADADDA